MKRTQPTSVGNVLLGLMDPKETKYRGITFRSRLEADFARHLDHQGVQWRYEPAIYGPVGEGYLPDFRVDHDDGSIDFIEIKPTLDQVPRARARMQVIWQDEPDAALIIACAEGSRFFAAIAGGQWTNWASLWKHW